MELFAHQKKLIDACPARTVLCWETGTGKSLASIELAKKISSLPTQRNRIGNRTLIICPKSLKANWREMVHGKGAFCVMTKEEFKRDYETLDDFDIVIVDEAHYFFGTKSQLMKSLKAYFKKNNTPYRIFLTATPYRSSPMDIYVMAQLLGYPMNYQEFFNRFFYHIRMGHRIIPQIRSGIEDDIAAIVRRIGSIVRLDECVDVPTQNFEVEYFQPTKEQLKAMADVDEFLPIVRFTKHHQICGGTLKGDEYTKPRTFTSDKFDRLLELAEENKRMIVVCRYNHEIEYLHKNIKNSWVINGETPGEDRHKIVKSLQSSDSYTLLVNAACSEGWEIPECPLMVFYSYDFSLKNYIQMLGRIQRINNVKKNTYLSLITKDTIDEDVYHCIQKKEDFNIAIYSKENK